jgi:GTPase SAR1 family protein
MRKTARCINLDPAADPFRYTCEIDIRDLISLDDVVEEMDLGPNGGLVYAMEYLVDNLDWLTSQLDEFPDDEYFLIDCPGQIELYSHIPVMRRFVDTLRDLDFYVAGVYCIDSTFVTSEPAKFLAGSFAALSAMIHLELSHVNVLTKCDLLSKKEKRTVLQTIEGNATTLAHALQEGMHPRYKALNEAMGAVLEDFSLVSFQMLDSSDEDSIGDLLLTINNAIQYGENLEPQEPKDLDEPEEDMDFDKWNDIDFNRESMSG